MNSVTKLVEQKLASVTSTKEHIISNIKHQEAELAEQKFRLLSFEKQEEELIQFLNSNKQGTNDVVL